MIRDITLGQYYPAKSVIHQLDPRVKLVATMLYIISLFVAKGILGYVIATIFLVFVIRTSKVPFKFITKGLKAIVMLLMITVVFNLFLIDGDVLVERWENNDFWSRMVTSASKFYNRATFEQIVAASLNVNSFDFVSAVARWKTLSDFQKELVWLWYRVYPTGDYYSYACHKASVASDIPARIRDEILLISNRSASWIEHILTIL